MEKINLNLTGVTVIEVTKALRARKGDYILVEKNGDMSVVPAKIYKAMSTLLGHKRANAGFNAPKYQPQTDKGAVVKPQIIEALKKHSALLTAQLEVYVKIDWLHTVNERRSYIGKICDRLLELGIVEKVKVECPNATGRRSVQSLWALKNDKKGLALQNELALMKADSELYRANDSLPNFEVN